MRKSRGHLTPTPLARLVVPFLCMHFERFMRYDYTSQLEAALDGIASGNEDWQALLAGETMELQAMVQQVMDRSQSDVLTELFDSLEEHFMPVRVWRRSLLSMMVNMTVNADARGEAVP